MANHKYQKYLKHIPYQVILGTFPYRRLKTSSRNSSKITNKRENRQLVGQSSSTPFMGIKYSYINKRVIFDAKDGLKEKIDRFTTMMHKLMVQDDGQNKQFKPKIFQDKRRGQTRNSYVKQNYDQRNYQNKFRSDSRDRRISFSGRIQCG